MLLSTKGECWQRKKKGREQKIAVGKDLGTGSL